MDTTMGNVIYLTMSLNSGGVEVRGDYNYKNISLHAATLVAWETIDRCAPEEVWLPAIEDISTRIIRALQEHADRIRPPERT